MRTECKHFESRTYSNGDAMRRCRLDLAPDAPWRCPDECAKFDHRAVDIGWAHGSIAPTAMPAEPASVRDSVASVLSDAEAIINAMADDIASEIKEKKNKKKKRKGK